MKKASPLFLLLILILNNVFAGSAFAYSYGDPNEEKAAELYKDMLIKLDQTPTDFKEARKIFETIKEEIDMHMGKEPAQIILKDLDAEDKDKTIKDMDQLLVLNIARRLESIDSNFAEYDTSKRLLAKAFATYEALSPKVEAEKPETDQLIRKEFDKALNALGNPGLFGVGKKESNQNEFKKSKDKILDELKQQYKIKSLEVGHFSESSTVTESRKKELTDTSKFKNWIPILLIVGLIAGVVFFTIRKRK